MMNDKAYRKGMSDFANGINFNHHKMMTEASAVEVFSWKQGWNEVRDIVAKTMIGVDSLSIEG